MEVQRTYLHGGDEGGRNTAGSGWRGVRVCYKGYLGVAGLSLKKGLPLLFAGHSFMGGLFYPLEVEYPHPVIAFPRSLTIDGVPILPENMPYLTI